MCCGVVGANVALQPLLHAAVIAIVVVVVAVVTVVIVFKLLVHGCWLPSLTSSFVDSVAHAVDVAASAVAGDFPWRRALANFYHGDVLWGAPFPACREECYCFCWIVVVFHTVLLILLSHLTLPALTQMLQILVVINDVAVEF